MTVGEQALYFAQLKGMNQKDAKAELVKWFRKFEIMSWWHKKVEELSKGMQQKVQFITTVIHRPKLLIFDEPFSGFDPINADLLKNEILELKKEGATIIFSTHNMESVEQICDNIVLINKSKKILEGNVYDVKQTFKSNIFELTFNGHFDKMRASLSAEYEILSVNEIKNGSKIQIKILNGLSTNELLTKMISFGSVSSFQELIPSMNEVFIKAVNQAG
jgi:ABC-2 type transport system ATP-binding protein